MKQEEVNQLSVEDLKDQLISSTEKLEKMILTHKVSYLENPLQLRSMRRTIARLKTELTKRENMA